MPRKTATMPDPVALLAGLKIPTIDTAAMETSHRKNVEALVAANRQIMEGAQSMILRQAELARESVEALTRTVEAVITADTPEARVEAQQVAVTEATEAALADMQAVVELAAGTTGATFDILQRRIAESVDETRQAVQPAV